MATCDFSGLDEAACDHCRRGGKPARCPAAAAPGPWIEARYHGQCRACGEPYTPGVLIRRDEETGGWVAECCAGEDA